jgi:hypothetical protein
MILENWRDRKMDLVQEERKLSEFLIDQVTSKASGRIDTECVGNHPRDIYFIGNLRPAFNAGIQTHRIPQDLETKLSPVAFGGEFNLRLSEKSFFTIKLDWFCYYRVFPSFLEQYRFQFQKDPGEMDDHTSINTPIISSNAPISTSPGNRRAGIRGYLSLHFKKIECSAFGNITLRRENGKWTCNKTELENSITSELARAKEIVRSDLTSFKSMKGIDDGFTISDADLRDEETYNRFLQSLTTTIIPNWIWNIEFDIKEINLNNIAALFSFKFTNGSQINPRSHNMEGFFFDPIASFIYIDTDVLPFEVDLAKKGFRYNQNIWTKGFNCGIKRISPTSFRTDSVPTYYQKRYKTKQIPNAPFDQLAKDPIPTLDLVSAAMKEYLKQWDIAEQSYKQKFSTWQDEYSTEFLKDKSAYIQEIARFDEGVSQIKNNPDIQLAFKLTNRTFEHAGLLNNPQKTEWRLFQLVFLVSQIPDISILADPLNPAERRKYVDIIYFPTGGGKTEAYLSVIVFNCFFDRLRGKQGGTTAWLRFPLRLLTLQQTQRMADIIGISDLIRKKSTDPRLSGNSIDNFAVGYYVGESSTPNELKEISNEGLPEANWLKAKIPEERQKWKRIVKCPSCGTNTVSVDFDEQNIRLIHRCSNKSCEFPNGEIPIYIVDNEIYRYLPSVIVGTIDKLAALGNQQKISLVLGKVDGKCPIHGYYNGKKCIQKGCNGKKLSKDIPTGITGPTLFIQDELHLIKEGLGTFDSHYETFIQTLLENFGNKQPLKIIASSATIEAFDRQIEHLYGRESRYARIFPGFGPILEDSFYAETLDDIQRIYLGVIPHNKTIIRAVVEFIEYYHEIIENLRNIPVTSPNPYGGEIKTRSGEWEKIIDLYSTSLYYFQKIGTLDNVAGDIKNAVNPDLSKKGLDSITFAELTGSTISDEVANTLERLERFDPNQMSRINMILATNMVSHGVDINRLNAMFFYGMTRSNAEYIQASSRVGRSHTGIVFDFFKPIMERDQSYYEYFYKYHQFLGQLVEPVAINRWSKFSIERTLPGLFMGVILQQIATNQTRESPGSYYHLNVIKKKIDSGEITPDNFIPILDKSYLRDLNPTDLINNFVRGEISRLIDFYLDSIVSARPPAGSSSFVSNALTPPPMMSLRDVDEKIEISLDQNGWKWAPQRRRG